MIKFLKKTLRVEGTEFPALLWMLLFGSFLGISVSLYDLASVTNFLVVYNNSYLPGAIICSGLMGIFTANTFISIQNWVSYTKVASFTLLVLVLVTLIVNLNLGTHPSDSLVYVCFVLAGPITILSLLVFWGLFEKLFDLAQGRRLSTGAEAGMILTSVITLSVVALSNHAFFKDLSNLYTISFFSILFALFTIFFISNKYPFLKQIVINVQYIKAYNNYKKLIKQPYILLLSTCSLLSGIAFFITDYTYLFFVDVQYTTLESTLNFLAGFSASVIMVGFVIQVFLVQWVNAKYGYLVSLLVLPALLGLFTAIYALVGSIESYAPQNSVFFFLFMLVCISKLFSVSLYKSLEFSTFKFFFMPLDNLLRADLQSKVERVAREAGKCLAGLIVVLVIYYVDFSLLPYVLVGLLVAFGFFINKLNLAYREKLMITLDQKEEIEKKEKVSSGVIDHLVKIIPASSVKEIEVYLSLLKILDPVVYKDSVLNLLQHDDEEIQKLALLETSKLCLLPAIPVLVKVKASKFYPVLRTRSLIDKVFTQLKAAEFRLEKVKYIEQLTLSKLRYERVFGALLAAYAEEAMKPRLLNKLFRDSDSLVRYSAVVSSACSENIDLQKNLIEKLGDSFYGNAALSAVIATGEKIFPAMENAFYLTGQDEKIQLRVVQAYGRVGDEKAVQLLLKKLNYSNHNVNRAAFEAVSTCGFNITGERVLQFKAELEEYVNVLVWNMSVYLDLKNHSATEVLFQALTSEVESNYDSIFKLLSLLYDPKTIALIKDNIFSDDPEKSEYAFGLLEVTLEDAIKPFLLPVLNNSSYETKVERMQEYFPTDSMKKVDILYDLIQRDYKYVNRWTKACALKELSEENGEIDLDIFMANVINPDSLLRETAAVALYIKAPDLFPPTFDRFQRDLGTGYSKEVVRKILTSGGNVVSPEVTETDVNVLTEPGSNPIENKKVDYFSAPNLQFEIIKFLNGVSEFKSVPGIVLVELAKITSFIKFKEGDQIKVYESKDDLDYYLVRSGKIKLLNEQGEISSYKEGALIHNFYLMDLNDEAIKLVAGSDCEIYKIKQDEFNEVMSFYDAISFSIINNIKKENLKAKSTLLV